MSLGHPGEPGRRRFAHVAAAVVAAAALLGCAAAPRAETGTVTRAEGPAPSAEVSVLGPGMLAVSNFPLPLPTVQRYVQEAFAAEGLALRPFSPSDTLLASVPALMRGREVTYRVRLAGPPPWLVVMDGAYGAPGDTVRVVADRQGTRVGRDAWQRLFNVIDRLNERRLQGR